MVAGPKDSEGYYEDIPEASNKKNAAPKPKTAVKPKIKSPGKKPEKASVTAESSAKTQAVAENKATKKKVTNANEKEVISFSTNVLHNAAWLVYLNGLEVQAMSVSVQFGVWQIPTAQVTLPPHVILQRLGFEDRIMVTIFYLDEFYEPGNPKYRLMGEFELVEWSYMNTGSGRSIQLSCRSPLQIFEQLKFYYMSSLDDIVTANGNVGAGLGDTASVTHVLYPQSLFHNGLIPTRSDRSEELPELDFIKTPSGFIWNLFKGIMGKIAYTTATDPAAELEAEDPEGKVPPTACAIPGRNFFGRWMFKHQFQRRWVGLYGFDDENSGNVFPLLEAQNNTEVMQALQMQIGQSVGAAGTAWELLQKIMGVMLMEINTTPAPPAGQVSASTRLYAGEFIKKGSDTTPDYGAIYAHYVKPQCIFAVPPTCNIIFPSMITSYSFAENYMAQPTRIYLGEDFLNKILNSTADGTTKSTTSQLLTTGYPPTVKYWMRQYITAPEQNTKNFLLYPEEFFKGPVIKHMSVPPWTYMLDLYYKAIGKKTETSDYVDQGPPAPVKVVPLKGESDLKRAKDLMTIYRALITDYSKRLGVPPEAEPFILSLIWTESRGDIRSRSYSGYIGLGQLGNINERMVQLADTGLFSEEYLKAKVPGYKENPGDRENATGPYNPEINLALCVNYIKRLSRSAMFDMKPSDFDINQLNQNLTVGAAPNKLQALFKGYVDGPNGPWGAKAMYLKGKAGTYDNNDPGWVGASKNAHTNVKDPNSPLKKGVKVGGMNTWQYRSGATFRAWATLNNLTTSGDALVVSASSPAISPAQKDSLQTLTPEKAAGTTADAEMQALLDLDPGAATDKTETLTAADAYTPDGPGPGTFGSGPDLNQGYSGVKPQSTAVAGESATTEGDIQAEGLLGGIFDIYAKYEYYKARYEPRSANVSLAFDPYLVPGFPAVVFDSRVSKLDTIGYVMSVSHSWDAESPSISTQVTLSYTKSFPEFIGLAKNGDGELALEGYLGMMNDSSFLSYPREPVVDVANLLQTHEAANVYKCLFYPNDSALNRDLIFNWREMLNVYTVAGSEVKDFAHWKWDEGMFVEPKDKYAKMFNSYDSAMHYVARPAITLQEYVHLRSGQTVEVLRAKEEAAHKKEKTAIDASTREDSSYMTDFHLGTIKVTEIGAEYYSRIFGLLQGPQILDPVTFGQVTGVNYLAIRDGYQSPIMTSEDWTNHDVDAGLADTRQNWDNILHTYRRIMRSQQFNK
jgi:hypothetical protein